MKRNVLVSGLLTLALSIALAGAQPIVQVTFKNYDDLGQAINRIASAVKPAAQIDAAQQFGALMGLTNRASFDSKGPWQLAFWYDGAGGKPLLAVKGPIADMAKFKESLSPQGFLRKQGQEWEQLPNGQGAITFKPSNLLTESEAPALTQWKAEAIRPPKKTVELSARLTEPLRQQAKALLGIAQMSMVQAMNSNGALAASGANPKAMTEMFKAYFELIGTFVDGFEVLKVGLEVTPEALLVDEVITAKAGSELLRWMQPSAEHVTAADLALLDPEASVAMAAYVGKNDSLVNLLQKFTALGLQMQNMDTNAAMGKDFAALFEKMLPMKFAGSVNLKDKLSFYGAYTFPGGSATEAYAQMKRFFKESMQSQVGNDKMYSAATMVEKHHTVNGVSIDRFSMTMNLDNPMFKAPGQKAQLEAFWPDGKMEFDYALKDGKLLLAPAAGNAMQDLLEGKFNHKTSMELDKSACLAGYVNLLDAVKGMMKANPMVPASVKQKLARLDAQKTALEFQVILDNQARFTVQAPLKLFRELGRLNARER